MKYRYGYLTHDYIQKWTCLQIPIAMICPYFLEAVFAAFIVCLNDLGTRYFVRMLNMSITCERHPCFMGTFYPTALFYHTFYARVPPVY
jgi:hypothetical protein